MRLRLIVFFALATLAGKAVWAVRPLDYAEPLQQAQALLAAGDYARAHAEYARHAGDNPLAQFTLGLFEQNGWGRPADPAAACRWFERAAAGNIPTAQHLLGDCLVRGIHCPADAKAGLEWYLKAGAGGHLISLCAAGDLYIEGKGVDKNPDQGLALCAQAARANSVPAMLRLADRYRRGGAVKQDLAAARYWYQQAAERRSPQAQYRLGLMLVEGQGGKADLNVALFWLETAAGEGYPPAYLPTAILYAHAPVQPKTGALAPEHLAKVYLWLSAAKASQPDPRQRNEIARLEAQVLAVMPATWRPRLDRQVAAHLAKYRH